MSITKLITVPALAALTLAASPLEAAPLSLYVSPDGRDAWSGRVAEARDDDGPFATLARARDELRTLRQRGEIPPTGAVVELAAGAYELAQAVAFGPEDSGVAEGPIVYRAAAGAEVRLIGGRVVTGWAPVTDPAVLARLDPSVHGRLLQADLRALGIADFGEVATTGARLELFFEDRPMTLSRWPNEGFARIVEVTGGAPHRIHGIEGDKIGRFVYEGDRPSRWLGEPDLWLHGYWFWDWAEQKQPVERIDTERHEIHLAPPYHTYGYRKGQWYYALNALAELDEPGEWYLDRGAGMLYFLPPGPIEGGRPMVSIAPSLLEVRDASFLTFRGFTLEACRANAVTVQGGESVRVEACTIRNTGSWAVSADGGSRHAVVGCDISETACGGISLAGGDRATLTPAGHVAENNHIHHYARWVRVYQPGVMIQGVGQRVAHNLIDNAPHMAMGFGGNDHVIEFNEIHSVCYESNDAGAIYAGRDWSTRGTVVRHNYFHDIRGFEGRGCVGVYLDDQWSGTTIFGNVFCNVTRAAMIGGGRDCVIENNVFVDCEPATHVDARGLGWAASGFEGLKGKLEALPYREALWAGRYPRLPGILEDDPMAPKGNVIARNVCVGGRWGDFEEKARPMVTFEANFLEGDPLFVDRESRDFRLRADSPVWALGFQEIPLGEIGLVRDADRASWPVESPVRP